MKKVFATFSLVALLAFGITASVIAQDSIQADTSATDTTVQADVETTTTEVVEEVGMHKALKQKFIEGDAMWMAPVAFALILGLALSIERIIYLSLSSTNTKKIIGKHRRSMVERWRIVGNGSL